MSENFIKPKEISGEGNKEKFKREKPYIDEVLDEVEIEQNKKLQEKNKKKWIEFGGKEKGMLVDEIHEMEKWTKWSMSNEILDKIRRDKIFTSFFGEDMGRKEYDFIDDPEEVIKMLLVYEAITKMELKLKNYIDAYEGNVLAGKTDEEFWEEVKNLLSNITEEEKQEIQDDIELLKKLTSDEDKKKNKLRKNMRLFHEIVIGEPLNKLSKEKLDKYGNLIKKHLISAELEDLSISDAAKKIEPEIKKEMGE